MHLSPRALGVAVFGVASTLLISACGGATTAGSANNLTPITGTSYVTILPATTTTTTTTVPGAAGGSAGTPGEISPTEQSYVIKSNDSLSKIAGLYDVEMQAICNYNKWADCIDPPHLLIPGQTVLIPPQAVIPGTGTPATPDAGGDTATPETTAAPSSGDCPTTYVITADDTSRIKVADKFGITFQEMDAANASTPGYQNFIVGTPITIPCPG